ncbi:MAG: ABC transporter substrate-binding protein [Rhodospirillaceae bacterium]|nr:ABC transporter substrate-binding protein [Rhodospirillaceae bacterium]
MRTIIARTLGGWLWLAGAFAPAMAAQELRMALISAPPSLGNPFGAVGPPSSFVWDALFDPLVAPTDTGDLAPALAERWSVEEPTRWRFHIRRGIQFSNGEPLDADAVAATIRWLIGPEGRRLVVGSEVAGIASVEVVDPFTVDIRTAAPDAILPKRLTPVAIVAPRAWAELGPDGFAQTPVGTGPFQLQSWTAGGRITLVAAPTSWRKPKLDRITFVVTSDPVARIQSLMSGQIDVAVALGPENVAELEGRDFTIISSPTPQVYSIAFNAIGRPQSIIADVRVRQAINYAVNKDAITEVMMRGRMRPTGQGATPMTFGYDPEIKPYPYDPDRARGLLVEAGVKPGIRLAADIVTNGLAGGPEFLALVQQDLAAVGLNLEIRSVPFADWLRKYVANTFDVELFGLSWNGAPYYDLIRSASYFSCQKPAPFFCDPEAMPLFDAAAGEFDVDRRRAILQRLARRLHETAPALFLYEVTDLAVVSPRVGNFRIRTRVPVYEELVMTGM